MKQIKDSPTLKDFQTYVKEMVVERGFDKETVPELFMLLLEECGEMAKSARKSSGIKTDDTSEKFSVSNEVADVFIYLLTICNKLDVDLEEAFRRKEEINNKRVWTK